MILIPILVQTVQLAVMMIARDGQAMLRLTIDGTFRIIMGQIIQY